MFADQALRLFKLLGSASIVIAFSYLLSTTKIGRQLLTVKDRAFTRKDQWLICLIFGGFAFYNALSITSHGADARIVGPLLAGFIAGPIVGTGVAIIGICGAIIEYELNISLSAAHTGDLLNSIIVINLLAGFSAGLFQRNSRQLVSIKSAAFFVLVFDIIIMFPAEVLLADNPRAFLETAVLIFPSMLIVHVLCVTMFLLLIRNFHNEQVAKAVEKKITLEKDIAQKIFKSLYSSADNPGKINPALTLSTYPAINTAEYTKRFIAQITAQNYFYFSYGYFFGAQTPVAMAISYLKPFFENLAQNHLPPLAMYTALKGNLRSFSEQNVRLRVIFGRINLRDNVFEYAGPENCQPLLIRDNKPQPLHNNFQLRNDDTLMVVNIEGKSQPSFNTFLSATGEFALNFIQQPQLTDALSVTIHNVPKTIARCRHSLACDGALIGPLLQQCREFCQNNRLPARAQRDIGLLLDETVSNAIKYSGIANLSDNDAIIVNIAFEIETQLLEVVMAWKGDYFDPLQYNLIPEQKSRIPGGWGIYLIKKITDTITFERKNDYNTLIMQKTYPESAK